MFAPEMLSSILVACGFRVRLWKAKRLYLSGYGRDVRAYLEADTSAGPSPADGYRLVVSSSWKVHQYNGLRCKGVKHAILEDLYVAGLLSKPPPARWQDVVLDAPQAARPAIIPYAPTLAAALESRSPLPTRQPRDPYAPLRAIHHKGTGA